MTATEPDPDDSGAAREPLHELTLGRSRPTVIGAEPIGEISSLVDARSGEIGAISASCRSKAEAARWAAERQRRIREGYGWTDQDGPNDRAVVEWAERLSDAFYWANATDSAALPDIAVLDLVGGCFETVAEALDFAKEEQDRHRGKGVERALKLVAEAQSALRQSLRNLRASEDPDQLAVHEWVRTTAAQSRVFLKRFMRADDLADPAAWPGLLARIEAAAGSGPQSESQRAILDDLRLRIEQIRGQGQGKSVDWHVVIERVGDALNAGVPPSNRELREVLLPVIDDVSDEEDLSPGFRLVVRRNRPVRRDPASRRRSGRAGGADRRGPASGAGDFSTDAASR